VRWDRPGHGLLPPSEFVDLAERNGLIIELGGQVLDQALAQLAEWSAAGADLIVGVNVSAQQLVSDQFVAAVDAAIRTHGVDAGRVRLELTETSLLVDPAVAARHLAALRDLGTQIALDDFGAGYASIGYLRTLPLDVLKIDQSFVAGLPGAEDDLAIVRFVIGLADTLGLAVTAEGIERAEQAEALVALGCHHGQGYLFERPVPAAVIAHRLGVGGALAG
jgi:EAL domain-containing protein (putative c-di-GMP-specific phosphodiesterase class I)